MNDRTLLSLQQAAALLSKPPGGGRKRWPRPDPEEIKGLRERLRLSQAEFARRYGIDAGSLKHWEGNRRFPEQAHCLLLKMIACDPEVVERLVQQVEYAVVEEQRKRQLEPA